MLRTVICTFGVLVVLPAASGVAKADDPTAGANAKSLESRVADLEKQLVKTNEQISALSENTTTIMQLHEKLQELTQQTQEEVTKQGQLLDAIAGRDEKENAYLRLDAIMEKSEAGRKQVQQAVERSIRPEGKLIVNNKMETPQEVIVDRERYVIHPGEHKTWTVRAGTVSTRLPGQELVTWTIGPANKYRQSVDIVPRYESYRPVNGAAAANVNPANVNSLVQAQPAPAPYMTYRVEPIYTYSAPSTVPLYTSYYYDYSYYDPWYSDGYGVWWY